jgi:hypothetical protein
MGDPPQHHTSASFWQAYKALPPGIRERADKQFCLLIANPQHPSLPFKKIGERQSHAAWSARASLSHRALAIRRPSSFLWFWIGDHNTYNNLIG